MGRAVAGVVAVAVGFPALRVKGLMLVVATTAGANSQQSLGTVIFGGLLVATVLSLGVVPPFYVAIKHLEERWFGSKAEAEAS